MEVLKTLQSRQSLTDVRDQAALESALYHLPTVFAKETLASVAVSFAAVSIRDLSCLLSSPTLQLSVSEVAALTRLARRLTAIIHRTVGAIRPRSSRKNVLGRGPTAKNRAKTRKPNRAP